MEPLKKEVDYILNSYFSSKYDLYYGISPDDIPFAILTTKGLWYKVRVLGNLNGRNKNAKNLKDDFFTSPLGEPNEIYLLVNRGIAIHATEHATENGAKEKFQQCKNELENGLNTSMFGDFIFHGFKSYFYFSQTALPSEVVDFPDKYLKPGDVVSTKFYLGSSHYAIYIGNGEVVHVSGHGGKKEASVARIGKFCPDFLKHDGTVERMEFSYTFRKPEKIVEIAKGYADTKFRKGSYHLLFQNCQHFVTLTVLGLEMSPDALIVKDNIKPYFLRIDKTGF